MLSLRETGKGKKEAELERNVISIFGALLAVKSDHGEPNPLGRSAATIIFVLSIVHLKGAGAVNNQ